MAFKTMLSCSVFVCVLAGPLVAQTGRPLALQLLSDSSSVAHLPFSLLSPDRHLLLEAESDSLGQWEGNLPASFREKQVRLVVLTPFYSSLDTLLALEGQAHVIKLQRRELQLDGVRVRGFRQINRGDALHRIFSFDPRSITRGTSLEMGLQMLPGVIPSGSGFSLIGKRE